MENKKRENDLDILRNFLNLPHSADAVLDRFSHLPRTVGETSQTEQVLSSSLPHVLSQCN